MSCCSIFEKDNSMKTPFSFLDNVDSERVQISHALLLTNLNPDIKRRILKDLLGNLRLFDEFAVENNWGMPSHEDGKIMDVAQKILRDCEMKYEINFPLIWPIYIHKRVVWNSPLPFLNNQEFEIARLTCCIILSKLKATCKIYCLQQFEFRFPSQLKAWSNEMLAKKGSVFLMSDEKFLMTQAQTMLNDKSFYNCEKQSSSRDSNGYARRANADALIEMGTMYFFSEKMTDLIYRNNGAPTNGFSSTITTDIDETENWNSAILSQSPQPVLNAADVHHSLPESAPSTQYNILLLGETGVGKSTFINSLLNYLNVPNFATAHNSLEVAMKTSFTITDSRMNPITITQYPTDKYTENCHSEGMKANGESTTQMPTMYKIPVNGTECGLNILDTPGINDTEGMERDLKNSRNVMIEMEKLGTIHAICVLMKPQKSRLTSDARYFLENILQLHRNTAKNIFFCFTNAKDGPGDTLASLEIYLKKIRENSKVDIHANEKNVFWFDNTCFRYLCALKHKGDFQTETLDFLNSVLWKQNVEMARKFLKKIRKSPSTPVIPTTNLSKIEPATYHIIEEMYKYSKSEHYDDGRIKYFLNMCIVMSKLFMQRSLICPKDPFMLKVGQMIENENSKKTAELSQWLQYYKHTLKAYVKQEATVQQVRDMMFNLRNYEEYKNLYMLLKSEGLILSVE